MDRSGTLVMMLSLVAALVALPQPAVAAKPIVVGDGTAAGCTETPLVSALAIAGATGGGTIKFKCGGGPVTIALTSTLSLPNNTTIDGGGLITLDGGGRFSQPACPFLLFPPLAVGVTVASVDGTATVALKNLTINGGGARGSLVGGIHNEGTLTLTHLTLTDNSGNDGGAIFNSGTLTVKNSAFSNNKSSFGGAGIRNLGTLIVDNSTFVENCSGEGAHAIYNEGTVTVNKSTFSDNGNFTEVWGAIYSAGTLTVTHSTFSNNFAGSDGGAIAAGGMLTVKNSTFTGNHAFEGAGAIAFGRGTLIVKHSSFSSNGTAFGGGAIAAGGTIDIDHSSFDGNVSGFGGGIWLPSPDSHASVTASTFSENVAHDSAGGGIFNQGTLLITHSTLSENHAVYGGGIFNFGTLQITNSTVSDNEASDITDFPGLPPTTNEGGGIFNAGTLALKNSRVIHNTATDLGGGIYNCIEGQVSEPFPSVPCHGTMTLTHTVVTENTPDDIFP